jgi:hypothetical protein
MEGGIVPNAASGIGVHFPSQCRPQDHLQQLGGPHGKIAAARRAARCRLFHRQSRAAAGRGSARYRVRGLDWDGGGGLAVFWVVAQHLGVEEVEVQKLGEPPKCGESHRAKGSKLPPMGIQRSPRNPWLCTSSCQVVKLAIAQISIQY